MSLDTIIKDRIRSDGPMPISEYMALALAHPEHGYYMRKDPFGVQGDFTTAPEISQIFGEVIGAWLVMQWIMMGKPKAALAETGPGRGTLMADILRATSKIKGFHSSISVHLMEISQTLRQKQWNTLAGKHPDIQWHLGFGEIPAKPLLLVANEFFDALPIRQFMHLEDGWKERKIGLSKKGGLQFIMEPAKPPPPLEDEAVSDTCYEYSEAATQMAIVIGSRILTYGGTALIIDYGYEGCHIHKWDVASKKQNPTCGFCHGDTLQAVRNHKYHNILRSPGTADITAHVDFYNLIKSAVAGGTTVYGPVGQGAFLNHLGARERAKMLCKKATKKQKAAIMSGLDRLIAPDKMGELFKALCLVHPDLPKPEGF